MTKTQGILTIATGALWGVGASVTGLHFNQGDPWFYVGLATCIVGTSVLNTGFIVCRSRSLNDEFEAGYRTGYREGRRAAPLVPVDGRKNGGLPKAPVRSLASHREASRREPSHAH